MDKHKENGILLFQREVIECCVEVGEIKKETELYNSIYKEISELVGLDATLKIYLRFKGQQVLFPVRLIPSSFHLLTFTHSNTAH